MAYMSGTNDDFDLPRWHTQQPHDTLSSSAQAAQSATQASSYLYNQGPPPQTAVSGNRLPAIHQSPNGPSRQPRITQLLDEDQQFAMNTTPYLSPGSTLTRSTSLGGAATTSRGRRHHTQDDLEGAFNVDSVPGQRQPAHTLSQHPQNSLYPSSVAYHQSPALPGTGSSANASNAGVGVADVYQDAYYPSTTSHPPKRSQTTHDASTSSRTPRSPHRGANPHGLLDPYSPQQQQNQYNPPSSAYPYSPTAEQQGFGASAYSGHSRTQSQVKAETMTPPIPNAYSPSSGMQTSGVYSPSYPMHTSSPALPSSSQNLTTTRSQGRGSVSQPATPLSYGHQGPPTSQSPYYGQDHQAMVVEPPPKRRASGLRRVRDQRDLQPYVNTQPVGRRMDGTGTFLSVSRHSCEQSGFPCLTRHILSAYPAIDHQHR